MSACRVLLRQAFAYHNTDDGEIKTIVIRQLFRYVIEIHLQNMQYPSPVYLANACIINFIQ